VGELEASLLVSNGAGESPPVVTEELAFQEAFGQRPAVDGHERPSAPVALVVNGVGHELLAGSRFSSNVDGKIVQGQFPDLFVQLEHLVISADDPGEALDLPEAGPQSDQVRHVSEGRQDPHEAPRFVQHSRDGHFDAPGLAALGRDVQGIGEPGQALDGTVAEGAAVAAQGPPENLVAVSAQDLVPAVAGDGFGGPVEEKDPAFRVVGDQALHQVVQDVLQVLLGRHQGFEGS